MAPGNCLLRREGAHVRAEFFSYQSEHGHYAKSAAAGARGALAIIADAPESNNRRSLGIALRRLWEGHGHEAN
jgi:hypothetical protein